jgi:hypothetical protein
MRVAGLDRAHHCLAGIDADARFERRISRRAQFRRVAAHLLLHAKCGVQRALRMVLVSNRRAKQRENPVAGRLHDIAVVAMRRIDHQLERRIDYRACFFGIDVLHQIHRAFDIRKQCRHGLALGVS